MEFPAPGTTPTVVVKKRMVVSTASIARMMLRSRRSAGESGMSDAL